MAEQKEEKKSLTLLYRGASVFQQAKSSELRLKSEASLSEKKVLVVAR